MAGEAGTVRFGWAGQSAAWQARKQTTDDHETSFVIMNKRPPKTQRMKRPFSALFSLTLSVTQETQSMTSFIPNLIYPLYRVRISGLMRLSQKEELIKFVLIILRHSLSLRYIRVYSHLSHNPHSIRGINENV
jgi:hypothetical protein